MCRSILLLLFVCSLSSGCTMFDYLQPHQLWKLNRQKAPTSESADAYFQIPATPRPDQIRDPL